MATNNDLASWLADILDDSKPLPVAPVEPEPTPAVELPGEVSLPAASPVDEFLSEYLGETESTVTQLCDEVKAGPVQTGFTRPPAPAVVAQAEPEQQEIKSFADEGTQVSPIVFPKFVVADFAAEVDLRNFATLVTLNTSRWHAKVKDREASKSAARVSDADPRAFETRKNLLAGVDGELKAVHKAIDEARAKHYQMTVPFSTTSIDDTGKRMGGRLLPNTLFDDYITEMANHRAAMNAALNVFIPNYPDLIEAARSMLGNRFLPSEYPPASNIRQRFALDFEFHPIPKGDDFKGLAATQLSALAKKLNQSLELQVENAMQDLWLRMHDAVSKMAERLGSPDKTFHGTLVQNVRDIARLAAHLNVTQDPKVESVRKLIEEHLCQHEPKDLREKPLLRQETAAWAQEILDRMSK